MGLYKKVFGFLRSEVSKATIWYILGRVITRGFGILTLPIFTRLLDPSDYGIVSVYNSWLSVAGNILPLGLKACVVRGKYDFPDDYDGFLSSVLALSFIPLSVSFLLASACAGPLSSLLGLKKELLPILVLHCFSMFFVTFYSARLSAEYRYKQFVAISIAVTVSSAVLSIFLVLHMPGRRFLGRILGGFLSYLFAGLPLALAVLLRGRRFVCPRYWSYALSISLPLIPHNLSGVLLAYFDRVMIDRFVGHASAGVYSFAYSVGMISYMVWVSANRAWVPWLYARLTEGNYRRLMRAQKKYVGAFTVTTAFLMCFSPQLARILGTARFLVGAHIIPVIIFSYFLVFMYSFPANLEFFEKRTYLISVATCISCAVNICLNWIFIPRYGYEAAAWTTLVSYGVLFCVHLFFASKFLRLGKLLPITYLGISFSILFLLLMSLTFAGGLIGAILNTFFFLSAVSVGAWWMLKDNQGG